MTAHVDAVRGTPIMDLATFETFIEYALGGPLDSAQTERLDRLHEAGIVPEDETDPIVAVVLRPLDHDTDDVEVLASQVAGSAADAASSVGSSSIGDAVSSLFG